MLSRTTRQLAARMATGRAPGASVWRCVFAASVTVLLITSLTCSAVAQTPAASPAATAGTGAIADIRALDVDGKGLALSPDGEWLAGVGPDQTPCFWDIETLTPQCADAELPIMVHIYYPAMAWAPDSSAVVFSLDAIRSGFDSDIYVFERESGALTNLTDDGYEGSLFEGEGDTPIDIVPSWSPDGRQIVFSRSARSGEGRSTAIMRIDRSGGEPVVIATLEGDEPLVVWMPMFWLPDDTILYSRSSADLDDPENGIWHVGVDGSNPQKIIPGDATSDIPGAVIADVDAVSGAISVYSPVLLSQYSTGWERPIFWIGTLADGALTPLPLYDVEAGASLDPSSVQPSDVFSYPLLNLPASPAALSPDGASALVVYRPVDGDPSLVMLDAPTGSVMSRTPLPEGTLLQPVAPQWVGNGTILLQGAEGWWLVTVEQEHPPE